MTPEWKDAAVELGIIGVDFDFTGFYTSHVAGEPGMTGALNILELLHEEDKPSYLKRERITSHKARGKAADRQTIIAAMTSDQSRQGEVRPPTRPPLSVDLHLCSDTLTLFYRQPI